MTLLALLIAPQMNKEFNEIWSTFNKVRGRIVKLLKRIVDIVNEFDYKQFQNVETWRETFPKYRK